MSTRLMSVTAVAEQLDCSRGHVYDLIAKGLLVPVDIGSATKSKTRIRTTDLEAFIETRTKPAPKGGEAGRSG